jgi:hypothetical protein
MSRFNLIRVVSVILAALGAALVWKPWGIYGSASTFLLVSSLGMIYAYHKYVPASR